MNAFYLALFLVILCFCFGLASFGCFWLATHPSVVPMSRLETVAMLCCRIFVATSAICGALAVLVVTAGLLALAGLV